MDEKDWDEVAATFDEEILNVPKHDRRGKIRAVVRRNAGPRRTAADIGCGIGRTIPLLAPLFAKVHATDISSRCLRRAEKDHARFRNVLYHHADLAHVLPFAPVDFVLCINVLLQASRTKRQAMLAQLCAAVKPGGELLLVVPAVESALYATHRLVLLHEAEGHKPAVAQRKASRDSTRFDMGIVTVDGVPTKHYLREELADLMMAQGMETPEIKKIEYPWPYALADAPYDMPPPLPWNWMAVARKPKRAVTGPAKA